MSANISELDYLKGFLDFMQNQGKMSEEDLADYNRQLETKRIVNAMMNTVR
jgi:hypothetical protein